MVRKISGKSKSASYHHLYTNFNDATSDETNSTTKKIQQILQVLHSTEILQIKIVLKRFKNLKTHQEKVKPNFKSSNNEEYNSPYNLDELKEAISKSHDTATGPDEIHYQMLKHLPPRSLEAVSKSGAILNPKDLMAFGMFL